MAEFAFDVVEQILLRLDVEDLIRCKSVCKSWLSFISTAHFVKAHLNRNIKSDRDNHQLGHQRICHSSYRSKGRVNFNEIIRIVGSSNGLVCISPKSVKLVVTNPSTREQKKLPTPPYQPHMYSRGMIRQEVCWGFGYDPCADDYKVIAGFRKRHDRKWTTFYALTLKSNTWKVIGEVRYRNIQYKSGVLCGGALYWFMKDGNKKKVVISLDLSAYEFKEIHLPDADDPDSDINYFRLGVLDDSLCVCLRWFSGPMKKWVMRNNKWELYVDHCETKYDVAHFMPFKLDSQKTCSLDGCIRVPSGRKYISESVFVKSLVSPHLHVNANDSYEGPLRNAKQGQGDAGSVKGGNKREMKRKRSKEPLVSIKGFSNE